MECRLTTSVRSAMVTIVESRIAAIPPMISASRAFLTAGVSFAASAARSTVVSVIPGLLLLDTNQYLKWTGRDQSRYYLVSYKQAVVVGPGPRAIAFMER